MQFNPGLILWGKHFQKKNRIHSHSRGQSWASLGTLRDHCTGNPPAGPIFKHFDTWHVHVRAVWAKHNVCNDLKHNVADKGRWNLGIFGLDWKNNGTILSKPRRVLIHSKKQVWPHIWCQDVRIDHYCTLFDFVFCVIPIKELNTVVFVTC